MNILEWRGDEKLEDLPDYWVELVEDGNKAQLVRSIESAVNRGVIECDEEFPGSEAMTIMMMAYGEDANRIIEMVKSSDDHEVGENLL